MMLSGAGPSERRESDGSNSPAAPGFPRPPVPERAVRAELERVLASSSFRYSERLRSFLKFVVEEGLAGNGDQLKESVLAVELFDREATYDSREDSLVRVEARRLRDKLQKYYAGEGINDPVFIDLPKGGYAPVFTMREAPPSPAAVTPRTRQVSIKVAAGAAVLCILATVALVQWVRPKPPGRLAAHRRITADPGLTFQPVLSRDGTLLAYSSDRAGAGNLDIWVQRISGGAPIRITDSPGDDVEPSFSHDGAQIAYRAEGEAEGVYIVPALGGTATLLARGGYRPRFSPDGSRVAYWTGERSYLAAKIFVVPSTGGAPSPLQPDFEYAAYPVWSPDGNHILFVGSERVTNYWDMRADDWDWWVAPAAGGSAVRTYARGAFKHQRLDAPQTSWSHRRVLPHWWTASSQVLFSALSGGKTNIWQIDIEAGAWRAAGHAEQVTFGAGWEDNPTASADGSMAYSVLTHKSDVCSQPLDPNAARTQGPMVRLTSDAADYIRPVVSNSGQRLAFLSNRSGNVDVWARDLKTGREAALTATRQDESSPVISPDGSKVAYGYAPPLADAIFVVPFAGGGAAQVCGDCGEPRAWLPDNAALLYQLITPSRESLIGRLDMDGRETVLIRSSKSALFSPSVSRDGRWLALIVRTPPSDHRVYAIPLRSGAAADPSEWVSVTPPGGWVDKPRWSPDGNVLYHVSDRDGFVCIWASRLDPATKRPAGEPIPIEHFHGRRTALGSVYGLELSVADDKLIFNLGEDFGNVWFAPAG
ncbi:MAG: PD40 domain-containing protein [Bryobacteraceae bacterium]|nr:PD40 domain-containing protein [Bryobacteraceae bacterium]